MIEKYITNLYFIVNDFDHNISNIEVNKLNFFNNISLLIN